MTANLIDGKAAAAALAGADRRRGRPLPHSARARARASPSSSSASDPASAVYVRSKGKATREAGMESFEHRLPASTSQDELIALVDRLNADPAVDGILVQLPLPPQIDERVIITRIRPTRTSTASTPVNAGRLAIGLHGFVPCTPLGCLMLLQAELGDLAGMDAVVVGRSNIVGKPMALLLLRRELHGHRSPIQPNPRPARRRPPRRHRRRRGRPAGDGQRRLAEARRDGHRRRHQPACRPTTARAACVGDVAFDAAVGGRRGDHARFPAASAR